jgi:hypothetical protein
MTKFHSKQSALARRKIGSFAVLLVLSKACMAGPPASADNSVLPPATQVPAHLAWPDSGIAQRRFTAGANGTMFVEDDHGKLHAWVLSDYTKLIDHDHADATALDFFSGKVIKVKVDLTENGHQDQAFTDSDGRYHFYSADPRFRFSGISMGASLPGLDLNGGSLNVSSTIVNGCAVHLDATAPKKNYLTDQEPAVVWQKFPIYHLDTGSRGCSSGFLHSMIGYALDLGDGTFLAAEGCFVFRLRKSDLSPVGSAPALRVVDESTVKAALAKLHGKTVDDPTGYLIKALNLPTAPDVSCKED